MAWNPLDKNANWTLSGSNLIATNTTSTWTGLRAVGSHSTGKWYFEVTMGVSGATGHSCICVATSGVTLSAFPSSASAWGYYHDQNHPEQGYLEHAGETAGQPYISESGVIGVAWDADAGKLWFRLDGTWINSGDPAAGTNPQFTSVTGTLLPLGAGFQITGSWTFTLNVGGSSFASTIPSGFSAWGQAATSGLFIPSPLNGLGSGGSLITNRIG